MDEKDKKCFNPNRRLRTAREQRGWSQAALAEQLGTTELTVGRWERGERSPQLFYRSKLCELFGMTAEELGLNLSVPKVEEFSASQQTPDTHTSSAAELAVQPEAIDKKVLFWGKQYAQSRRNRLAVGAGLLLIIALVVMFSARMIFPATIASHSAIHAASGPTSLLALMRGHILEDPPWAPTIDDPMTHYNVQTQWSTGTHCTFANGVLHLHSIGVNYCLANAQTFTDFHYQIQMTLLEGSQAGVVFRADGDSHVYYFFIDKHGKYGVEQVNQPNNSKMLSAGLIQGLKRTNQLDVVALGSDIKVFVNRQFVAEVQDSTFPSGYVGVCVDLDMSDSAQANVTTAIFQDTKVWT